MKLYSAELRPKILIALTVLIIMIIGCFPFQSEDLFMYLAIARRTLETGSFPQTDPFLFTLTNYHWQILHEWLSYFVFYGLFKTGGITLVTFFKALIICACLTLPLFFAPRTPAKIFLWSITALLIGFAASFRFVERSTLFSDFFATLVLIICLLENQKPSRLKFLLPGLFLLWVNLHPGFMLGWAVCFLFIMTNIKKLREKSFQQFILITALSVGICALNPDGFHGLFYPIIFALNEGQVFQKFYYEWYPSYHEIFLKKPELWIMAFLTVAYFIRISLQMKKKPFFEGAVFLLITLMAIKGIRFIPMLGYFMACIGLFLKEDFQIAKPLKILNPVLLLVCLVLIIKLLTTGYSSMGVERHFGFGIDEIAMPTTNLDIIKKSGFKGNMYNSHRFGSYLAWQWDGAPKIYYHGFITDTDFYLSDYQGLVSSKENFNRLVKKYNIQGFLIERLSSAKSMIDMVISSPDWQYIAKDPASLLFIRKDLIRRE